jgi:hypothetical protein
MEHEWESLMEQTFLLIYYGHMNLSDIRKLTAEERIWYIKRIDKEKQAEANAYKGNKK